MKGRLLVKWNESEKRCLVEATETALWKVVGEILLTIPVPNRIRVLFRDETAELEVGVRGKYIKDGITHPSMYVKEIYNHISLPSSQYEEAYLTCINAESNNYKFYWLRPQISGIQATYGRIGSERGEAFGVKDLQTPYPSYLYWIRYYEKLSKGYIDQTDIYLAPTKKETEKKDTEEKKEENLYKIPDFSRNLFDFLRSCARQYVNTMLTIKNENITQAMCDKARECIQKLGQSKNLQEFNEILTVILQISPRRARYINEMFARKTSDFGSIVQREETLLAAMEACVGGNHSRSAKDANTDCFEAHGISVLEATEKQKAEVLRHLEVPLRSRVKNIYRVIDKQRKAKFDAYLKKNGIKKVKEFWHGSRNENWLSIMLNGLQLNPNAHITGKMFGHGIYFAPKAQKSLGYTSCTGSYWAHGTSAKGFMGLYATAYGKPLFVNRAGQYTKASLGSHNCVHATPANTGLRNEEVVFYDEESIVLNYIVEFSA